MFSCGETLGHNFHIMGEGILLVLFFANYLILLIPVIIFQRRIIAFNFPGCVFAGGASVSNSLTESVGHCTL